MKTAILESRPVRVGYANLPASEWRWLARRLAGKTVRDFGAGHDLAIARYLFIRKGIDPSRYMAIDAELSGQQAGANGIPKLQAVYSYFHAAPVQPCHIALVSWPVNSEYAMDTLCPHLRKADEIILIGGNTDGSAVGTKALWQYLAGRRLLRVRRVRHGKQFTAHYGGEAVPVTVGRYKEEIAGLTDGLLAW